MASDSDPPLPTGKLSPELLRSLILTRLGARRPETLVRPAVGVDAAAVAVDEDGWAWVVKSDPITTASAAAGRLAVHVVCNDLAAMGAEPVGILPTLLFPAGTRPSEIAALAAEIDSTAQQLNVEVLGGHTEIAPGVVSALVVMSGIGRVRAARIVTAAGARVGDALILTKAAGLEGTAILASDFTERLGGVLDERVLVEARSFGDELSVVPEGLLAASLGATAMHDPTEGGVLGAVWELAEAAQVGVRVEASRIPVRAATRAVCSSLGVDPLRLIASGALLIACPDAEVMLRGLANAGIQATPIGEITAGRRVVRWEDGSETELTPPRRDELYRLLEEQAPARTTRGD